ncbi:MAG: helix-turn-helix domain-containing protein [Bacteroidota bacterium]|nr:helix-turn-helix domain-containing protein [Bacteroidota bacterium]
MSIEMYSMALLTASLLLSLFLAVVLLSNLHQKKGGAKILGVFMLLLAVFLFDFAWLNGNLGLQGNLVVAVVYLPVTLSLQPLLFLYVIRLVGVKKLTRRYFLHFIPSVICLLSFVLFLFFLPDEALSEIKSGPIYMPYPAFFPEGFNLFLIVFNEGLFFLQIPVYVVALLLILRKHHKRIRNHYSNLEGLSLSWFQGFILMYLIFLGSIMVAEYMVSVSEAVSDLIYTIETLIFLVFLGYFGIKQQDVLILPQESKLPYFDESREKELAEQLRKVMDDQKPFLDTHFTISILAALMGTNRMYVSVLLNDYLGQSFYTLINNYRIDEAVKILDDAESMRYTIEGIAHSVGFQSKSTFIKHFRVKTGQTPGAYRLLCNT